MDVRMHYLYLLHSAYTKGFGAVPAHKTIGMGLGEWILFRKYRDTEEDIDSLAEHLGVTREEITSFMHGWMGERFLTVRKRLRVHDAAELLTSSPELSMSDIARIVGFQDKTDFRKAFTTENGMTPRQWRKCRGSKVLYHINRILGEDRNRCPSTHTSIRYHRKHRCSDEGKLPARQA